MAELTITLNDEQLAALEVLAREADLSLDDWLTDRLGKIADRAAKPLQDKLRGLRLSAHGDTYEPENLHSAWVQVLGSAPGRYLSPQAIDQSVREGRK